MVEDGNVAVLGQAVVDDVKLPAGGFAFGVFFYEVELPGHVRHDRVSVLTGLNVGRDVEAVGHAVEFRLGENHRCFCTNNVGVEVRAQLRQVLAELLNFFAFVRRKFQTGAAIIAQRLVYQLLVLAGKFRMRAGEGLDYFVNVFAVIDSDRPILIDLDRVFFSGPHRRVRARLFDDVRLVRGEAGLISEIVERDDRALERHLTRVWRSDLIERMVRLRDRVFHGGIDRLGGLFPIGNG